MSLKGSWNPGSSFLLCPLGTDHTSPGPLAGSAAMASDPMASLVLRVRGSTDGQVDAWGCPSLEVLSAASSPLIFRKDPASPIWPLVSKAREMRR